jgi:hypothetical protein
MRGFDEVRLEAGDDDSGDELSRETSDIPPSTYLGQPSFRLLDISRNTEPTKSASSSPAPTPISRRNPTTYMTRDGSISPCLSDESISSRLSDEPEKIAEQYSRLAGAEARLENCVEDLKLEAETAWQVIGKAISMARERLEVTSDQAARYEKSIKAIDAQLRLCDAAIAAKTSEMRLYSSSMDQLNVNLRSHPSLLAPHQRQQAENVSSLERNLLQQKQQYAQLQEQQDNLRTASEKCHAQSKDAHVLVLKYEGMLEETKYATKIMIDEHVSRLKDYTDSLGLQDDDSSSVAVGVRKRSRSNIESPSPRHGTMQPRRNQRRSR